MTLQEANEHANRIKTCVEHVNLAIALAASEGVEVELILMQISSFGETERTLLDVSISVDPTNLD